MSSVDSLVNATEIINSVKPCLVWQMLYETNFGIHAFDKELNFISCRDGENHYFCTDWKIAVIYSAQENLPIN